ncbi:MAG: hypothetical protein P8P74_11325 [Crocinitomicaceae bacterium]|nr:hypothetical protein [Crocinitomicaceae bacterium]
MKYLSLIIFSFVVYAVTAQESSTKVILRDQLAPNYKIVFTSGLGVSTQRARSGKWNGEWYVPEISYSYDLSVSRRLKNHFWIGAGVSYDYYRFRSKVFVHSETGVSYSQGPNGLFPNTYSFTDGFERYSDRVNAYVSVPINVEYSSKNKIGMYAKMGMRLSFPVQNDFNNRKAETNIWINVSDPVHQIGDFSTMTLFGNYSFGLQIKSSTTIGTFGLSYSHRIVGSEKGSPVALRFDVGIQTQLSKGVNSRESIKSDVIPRKRREYVYLEILGNRLFYSLNFEHSIISQRIFRWNARVGGAIHQRGQVREKLGIVGSSFIVGEEHAFEFGLNMQLYERGQFEKDLAFAPMFGYRFEPKGNFFGRVVYTPVAYQSLQYLCSFIGCAEHCGAVSVGMRF